MNRKWLLLGLLPAALVAASAAKPKLELTRMTVSCPVAAGSCTLIATWVLPANWRPATDSLGVVWSQSVPTIATNLRTKYTDGTADTLLLSRTAAEGLAYGGGVVVTSYRQATSVTGRTTTTWTAAALPVSPPDPVTALQVSHTIIPMPDTFPTIADWHAKGIYSGFGGTTVATLRDSAGNALSFTCPAGGTRCPYITMCGLIQYADGKVAKRTRDASQRCDAAYAKLSAVTRAITPAQQARADSICITWSKMQITGDNSGTFTQETCDVPSPVGNVPVRVLPVSALASL